LNTKVFVLSATARVRGGLVAASTHETRWYPNGSGSSRVLDTVPGVSAAAVYYDAATDRAVVLRGTGPYAVMVVDGNGNVVMRRVVGYSIPTATPGHSGYEPLAVDSGEIYFATTYGGENRLVRYDIATLDSVFVADVDPSSLWGASRGWLVSPLYKNNTGPRPAATALGRAGGTQCRGAYPAIPGCCTLLGLDRSGAHGLVKTSDRGGGGIYTIDIVTGATTSLVGAYAGMNGSMFDSGWVLACGTVNTPGHLVVVQPPGADGRANVHQLGRVPGMGYDTCTGTAGEVAPGQPAA
jgi:hypothetical protein